MSDGRPSRSELATRSPKVDSAPRSSVVPLKARVMSAVTEPTGWLPISAAFASAASTIVLTCATRG